MKKLLKIVAGILVTFILVVIVAIVIITNFVDPNRFKPLIEEKTLETTGKALAIPGKLEWSFFPTLSIQTGKLTLKNAKGFSPENMLEINKAKISLKVMPLFVGKVELGDIILDGLNLHLTRKANGETNWALRDDKTPTTIEEKPVEKPDEKTEAAFAFASVPNIDIKDVHVTFNDEQTGQKFAMKNLSLQMKQFNMNRAFPVSLELDLQSEKPDFTAHIALDASVTLDLDKKYYRLDNMQLKVNDLETTANVTVDQRKQTIDGKFNVAPFNLRKFLTSFGQEVPPMKSANTLKKVGGSLTLKTTANTFQLSDVKFILDESQLDANVNMTDLKTMTGTFYANLDQINLDNYMPTSQAPARQAQTTQVTTTPSKRTTFKANIDGQVTVGKLQVYQMQLQNIVMQVKLRDNLINISSLTADLYKGTLKGNAVVDLRNPAPSYQTNMQLANIQLAALGQSLASKVSQLKNLSGTANFGANITTRGDTPDAIKQNLNGNAQLEVKNGVLKGVDFAYYLKLARAFVEQDPTQIVQTGPSETEFGNLTATANIVNGVINNNDLLLQSPTLKVTGKGQANLPTNKINYNLALTPQTSRMEGSQRVYEDGNVTYPLTVTGNLDNPSISLDKTALLQMITQGQGQKVKEQLQEKVGDVLKTFGF